MKILTRLMPYLKPLKLPLAVAYGCMVLLAISGAGLAFLAGPALGFMFSGSVDALLYTADGSLRTVWQLLPPSYASACEHLLITRGLAVVPALLVLNSIIKGVAQSGQFALLGRVSVRVQQGLRQDAFAALLRQTPQFFANHTQGDVMSRLTHDCSQVEQAVFYGLGSILRDTLAVTALLGFCFATDASLALWTLVVVPSAVLPLARFAKRLKRVSALGQGAQGAISQLVHETLAGIQVVQACQQEQTCADKLQAASAAHAKQMGLSYMVRAVRTPIMEILGSMAVAALVYNLAHDVRSGALDAAHTLSFITALMLLYDPLKKLGHVSDYLANGAAAAERIFALIDAPVSVPNTPHGPLLHGVQDGVSFCDVVFHHGTKQVLRGVTLQVPKGQMVALVGPSGAGKTTLAQLLMRFWDVSGGTVRIDGQDIRDVPLANLRSQMSHVGQETFLFDATVAQNIAYGRPDASMQDIQRAAQAAYAEEFIAALPKGYATRIGERGLRLSGGQKQRLAIARAILRDKPLLILDEATSSLDTQSERLVRAGLDALMAGRTSLVIAHRLATIRHADCIVVLREGQAVEQGTHDQLLAAGGHYAALCHQELVAMARSPEAEQGA